MFAVGLIQAEEEAEQKLFNPSSISVSGAISNSFHDIGQGIDILVTIYDLVFQNDDLQVDS